MLWKWNDISLVLGSFSSPHLHAICQQLRPSTQDTELVFAERERFCLLFRGSIHMIQNWTITLLYYSLQKEFQSFDSVDVCFYVCLCVCGWVCGWVGVIWQYVLFVTLLSPPCRAKSEQVYNNKWLNWLRVNKVQRPWNWQLTTQIRNPISVFLRISLCLCNGIFMIRSFSNISLSQHTHTHTT
jgi:hypothetical protein